MANLDFDDEDEPPMSSFDEDDDFDTKVDDCELDW